MNAIYRGKRQRCIFYEFHYASYRIVTKGGPPENAAQFEWLIHFITLPLYGERGGIVSRSHFPTCDCNSAL